MKKKGRVAAMAYAPGSANALKPIVDDLVRRGYQVDIYSFHPSAAAIFGVPMVGIKEYTGAFERRQKYDLLIVGNGGAGDPLNVFEIPAVARAKASGIPVMSVVDFWGSNEVRFPDNNWIPGAQRDLTYVPDYIVTLDDSASADLQAIGIAPSKIFPYGNPHFDQYESRVRAPEMKLPPYTIGFFSSGTIEARQALEALIALAIKQEDLLLSGAIQSSIIKFITVTQHPRTTPEFAEIERLIIESARHDPGLKINIQLSSEKSSDVLERVDVAVGLHSMLLIEAVIIGKGSVAYTTNEELERDFRQNIYQPSFAIRFGATRRIVDLIVARINENQKAQAYSR